MTQAARLTRVIRNGLVYDGLGSPPQPADIGLIGDRIAAVGDITGTDAPSIDATGLAVSPGFINILSHAWLSMQVDGGTPSELLQGVTTEVFGEAMSPGPANDAVVELIHSRRVPPEARVDFPTLAAGLDHLAHTGVAPNIASFIGGSNLRVLASGMDARPLTASEMTDLRRIVDQEMADGALGIGTALIYAPGNYADTDELTALCEVVGQHDGLYISHLRSEGDQFLECVHELITIIERAHCRGAIYHLKAAGAHNHHKMAEAISVIEQARSRGLSLDANMYPYTAGSTALAACIPPKFHIGGIPALQAHLADPTQRAAIAAELRTHSNTFENMYLGADYGRGILILADLADGTPSGGKYLPDVAALLGITDLADALLDIVARDHTVLACFFQMSEDNVRLGLRQPWVSIGSDAASGTDASDHDGSVHPRAYGSFARVLGHYSRDTGLFPLEEAIRRMTSLPAATLRLTDRGRLVEGAFADLVVFDPASINDQSTYPQPRQYATGVKHVLVNGEPVVADGVVLPARPGRRLRRGTESVNPGSVS